MKIGDNVTISYGVYFACHGRNQGHNPIAIEDGAYIGMRVSFISNNLQNVRGWGDNCTQECGSWNVFTCEQGCAVRGNSGRRSLQDSFLCRQFNGEVPVI